MLLDESLWIQTEKGKSYPKLEEDIAADVCIIGGGMTGIACAYNLVKEGLSVAVLERDKLGSKVSGNTTAKITSQHGLFYDYLVSTYGVDYAGKYLESNEKAIHDIEQNVREEKINCHFEKQSNYVYTTHKKEVDFLKQEQDALQKIGFSSIYSENPIPLPITSILASIEFPNQAQFHPLSYLYGLASAIEKRGGIIYENTLVEDVKQEGDSYLTYTADHVVKSRFVILATHFPILNVPGFYFLKMYQESSYLIAVDPHDTLFEGMYITAKGPVTSYRTATIDGKKLLLVGGSNHKTGHNETIDQSYSNLEKAALDLYPNAEVLYRWNTRDCISVDKIPYIGSFSKMMPNCFVATGFKKWGMTTSHVAASILTDLILGKENPYASIYTSTRFHPLKNHTEVENMLKQTVTSLAIEPLQIPSDTLDSIEVGEGKILELEGKKVGVYRQSQDSYSMVKPNCSHLGCELSFNCIDKTWDCPCHGSRFDFMGNSLYDPSIKPLTRYCPEDI